MLLDIHPPIAPSRTASDCFALERVSSGNGTPVKSKAAPPIGISLNPNSIPDTSNFSQFLKPYKLDIHPNNILIKILSFPV